MTQDSLTDRQLLVRAFAGLRVARYEITLQSRSHGSLPAFLGSTLRGAFGHALKEAVCIMPRRRCENCLAQEHCLYHYLFETPAPQDAPLLQGQQSAPRPFILEPPAPVFQEAATSSGPAAKQSWRFTPDTPLTFGLWLTGRAAEMAPYVVYAIKLMAEAGLGVGRTPFYLADTQLCNPQGHRVSVYSADTGQFEPQAGRAYSLAEWIEQRLKTINPGETVRLQFLTPTRIRVAGDLQAGLDFAGLTRNLLRRLSLLCIAHGTGPLTLDFRQLIERAATVATRQARLSWHDWERHSNRQRRKMKLGGFMGEIEYSGPALADFWPLLLAGEFLHLGAGTAFGLGRYQITGP